MVQECSHHTGAGAGGRVRRGLHVGCVPTIERGLSGEEDFAHFKFLRCRTTGEDFFKSGGDEGGGAFPLRGRQRRAEARGERGGGVGDELAVRERERLLRHDAACAPVALRRVRGVEDCPELTATAQLWMATVVEAAARRRERLGVFQFLPAHAPVERARQREQRIAHHLGFHAAGVHAGEEAVFGVGSGRNDGVMERWSSGLALHHFITPMLHHSAAASSIRRARHDEPVQVLHAPARLAELRREPIEQLRVRGPRAAAAEVVHGAHERLAEVPAPDVIHRHARGERVVARGDPLGERPAPPRARRRIRRREGGVIRGVLRQRRLGIGDHFLRGGECGVRLLLGGLGGFLRLVVLRGLGLLLHGVQVRRRLQQLSFHVGEVELPLRLAGRAGQGVRVAARAKKPRLVRRNARVDGFALCLDDGESRGGQG